MKQENLRKRLKQLMTATCVLPATAVAQHTSAPQRNVLFIVVDDMQSDAIRYLGNRNVRTPNIDRLMKSGVTFTHTYTNGALCGALSMPSRAMLLTGRGVFQIQSDGQKIPECHTTMPEMLRQNGFRTFATGKWHSDKASFNRSFEEGENIFFGGMHHYETKGHTAPTLRHYDPTGKYGKEVTFTGQKFSSQMFADAAVDFINSTATDQRPFMAYVAFTSPHDPRNAHPVDYGRVYDSRRVVLPDNFLPQHPFDNGELDIRDERLLPAPRTPEAMRKELALYYNMVSEVDVQIGRVLDALKKADKLDNTIIVFASDNGLAMGQNGLIGKQSLYEHSVGVPMAIVDPDNKRNRRTKSEALCYLFDIYPTVCELLHLPVPESVSGRSLVPTLRNPKHPHRDQLLLIYANQQRALVKNDYKYIIYQVDGTITEQLFDLKADPGELNNLADKEKAKSAAYKEMLGKAMKEANDFCSLDQPRWWKDGRKIEWGELVRLYIFDKKKK